MHLGHEILTAGGHILRHLLALLAAVVALVLAGCADRGDWLAGWAKAELTPPFATPLAGYSSRGSALSTGSRDPLYARALLLQDAQGRRLALVECDLIAVSRELKEAVVRRLPTRLRLDGDRLLLCATHTHAGPGGASANPLAQLGSGDADPRILPWLAARIAAAVESSGRRLVPCRLESSAGWVDGLAKNRRTSRGLVDGRLGVLRVLPRSGAPGVLVAHMAMHPTVLPASHRTFSADFPGAFARAVESSGYALAVFVNGAEGDQAPAGIPGATPDAAVEVIGGRLAAAALRQAAGPSQPLRPVLHVQARTVKLPPSSFAAWVPRSAAVFVAELDSLLLYAIPGEPVAQVGEEFRQLARRMGYGAGWLVSLANDHLGYFDTMAGFARNTYESNLTFHGPDSPQALLAALPAMASRGEAVRREAADDLAARHARALADASVSRRGGGWYLKVSGTPREMGFQHGALLREPIRALYVEFQTWIDARAREAADERSAGLGRLAWLVRPAGVLVPWLCLKARELQPFIAPELLEEIAGIAEGAGVPYDGLLFMNVLLTMSEQEDRARWFFSGPRGTCTNLVCLPPRTGGEVLVARNLDWGMEDLLPRYAAVILFEPAGGIPVVSVGWAGVAGTLTAMNGEGLSITEESVAAPRDTRYHGEPVMLQLRRVAQHARDLDEAVAMIRAAPGTCGYHITIADGRRGEARVIERAATHMAVRRPRAGELTGVPLVREAGDYVGEAPSPSVLPRSDASSDRRYGRMAVMLGEHRGALSPERLRGMLADPGGGIAGAGTLQSVVFVPARFAGWIAHGTVPAPAGGYTWWDFTREVTRHRLLGVTRRRFEAVFGPSPAWGGIDAPVTPAVEVVERAGPGRPFAVIDARMPSTVISSAAANNVLQVRLYEPPGSPAGTVIFLPMWKGRERDAEDVVARALARRGFRIALMPMAYQWMRSPPGIRSGSLTVSADAGRTKAAVAQTLADVERLARWLTVRDPASTGRLGIMGLSLGGFVASTAFAVDPQFACGIFVLAGGDVAGALLSGAPDVGDVAAALRARGASAARVRADYAMLSPETTADPARGRRVLLVNALFDRVVTYDNARRLARAWGRPVRFWVPGGHHTALLFLDPFLDACEAHLRRWLVWKG